MTVYRQRRRSGDGKERVRWMIDVTGECDGQTVRVLRVASEQSERGAQREERDVIAQLRAGTYVSPRAKRAVRVEPKPERETVATFAARWLDTYAATNNKPSEVESKRSIVRMHLVPAFGDLSLDAVTVRAIEEYKASKLKAELSAKTINNHLTVLRRLLATAHEWGELAEVPRVKWLRAPKPEPRFLDFDEARRLIEGAAPEWRCLITVAVRTGLRLGELRALRWCDVDLSRSRLVVRRAAARKVIGTPKSGKSREVDLCDEARDALKSHRHLRGELVFCGDGGRLLSREELKWPLWGACRRAGLERIGWHVLRHTFASHLVMLGASMRAAQELLGHADLKMTLRYAHLSPESRREAVRLLDSPRYPDATQAVANATK
jgi:integrase